MGLSKLTISPVQLIYTYTPPRERVLVDSSVWVAFWLASDPQHEKGLKLVEKFSKEGQIYTHSVIAAEVITVLRNRKAEHIDVIYKEILEEVYGIFDTTPFDLAAIQPYFLKFPKLSVVDAFLLYLTWERNYLLVTLDKNLYKAAKELGLKVIGI